MRWRAVLVFRTFVTCFSIVMMKRHKNVHSTTAASPFSIVSLIDRRCRLDQIDTCKIVCGCAVVEKDNKCNAVYCVRI